MAELINNSNYQDFTLEQLKTQDGITRLNNILKKLSDGLPSDGESVKIFQGIGTPEGSIAAGIGSIYMRTDGSTGTSSYIKESGTGNTGWVAVTSSSGGAALTVEEQDGTPSVTNVVKIKVSNNKLTDNGSGVVSVSIGDGDVVGPSSAVDNRIATFNSTTGKLIKDSGYLISDTLGTGDVVGPASAVTGRIATYNGTTGKLIQDGGSTIAEVTPGLTLVSVTSFTAASDSGSIAITGGQMYRVIINVVFSGTTYLNIYSGSGSFHGGYYVNYPTTSGSTVTTTNNGGNVTAFRFGDSDTETTVVGDMIPWQAGIATGFSYIYQQTMGPAYSKFSTGMFARSSAGGTVTDFRLYPTAGTMTGTVWVYKYRYAV